jgi:hypothetical protein
MSSEKTARIVIKIKDEYFLNKEIYELYNNKLIVHKTIFSEWNLRVINELFPAVKLNRSEPIFQRLFSQLAGLSESFSEKFVLESLFSVIDNTDVCNLMFEAGKRGKNEAENVLNFFFIETSEKKAADVLAKIKNLDNPGIAYAYIRGRLDELPNGPNILSDSINDKVIEDIDNLFLQYGVKDFDSDNTRIVDVEQSWNFSNEGIRRLNLGSKPILGGGHNFDDGGKKNHGTNTLNVLFGEEQAPDKSTLNGLCRGGNVRVASTWFSETDERCEAALASLFRVELDNNGNRVANTDRVLNIGDIILLELQVTIPGDNRYYPVEIEPAKYRVIKLGIDAGFIIIEAAGNGAHDLNVPVSGYKDLSTNESGTGAIMVGAIEKTNSTIPSKHKDTNFGRRVDSYCYGNDVAILTRMIFNSTSLASAVIAGLAANLQKKAKESGSILNIIQMKSFLSSLPFQLPNNGSTFKKLYNRNINKTIIEMENKKKLSHQGIRETTLASARVLKERFKTDFIDNSISMAGSVDGSVPKLVTTGYFIGKALLNRILTENEDAAGIIFSFGLNKRVAEGGQLQLVLELASGVEMDNVPNYIAEREIYATGEPGNGGPDGVIPAIKPTPPPPPR